MSGVIHNKSNEPLVVSVPCSSESDTHYHFWHGTPADNLASIAKTGLDPAHGGSHKGSASHESFVSSASETRGVIKYGLDINVGHKYAVGPAQPDNGSKPKVGVLLQVRVDRNDLKSKWKNTDESLLAMTNSGRYNAGEQIWKREAGGEDVITKASKGLKHLAFNKAGGPDGTLDRPCAAVETTCRIPIDDIQIIAIVIPAQSSCDISELYKNWGTKRIPYALFNFDAATPVLKKRWTEYTQLCKLDGKVYVHYSTLGAFFPYKFI